MKQKKTRGLHTTREKTASNRLFKIASDTKQKGLLLKTGLNAI